MPDYVAPGVHIHETPTGPHPIEGVATGIAAFLGETERGPTSPRFVTSFADYRQRFGSTLADGRYLPDAVAGFFENGGRRACICRIVREDAETATRSAGGLRIVAKGPGAWGNLLFVKLVAGSTLKPDGTPIGFRLQMAFWQTPAAGGQYSDPFDPGLMPRPPQPDMIEDFDDLMWDDPASPAHFERVLESSKLAVISAPQPLAALPAAAFGPLSGGTEGVAPPGLAQFAGENADSARRTGLAALDLDAFREVELVIAPGAPADVAGLVITHCENNRFRFAVIDPPPGSDPSAFDPRSSRASGHAACYFPWIWVADMLSGQRKLIPPGGHVLGLYARTDAERGVFKAPANEVLQGVLGLEQQIGEHQQQVLNSRGVNLIRPFEGRGIRVWGARTLSADPQWKYVNVRRTLSFLERSIFEGTRWAAFELNDETLWVRVKLNIQNFLLTEWRKGALMGAKEEQAYFVACDRSTMTPDDLANGRLVCRIGVAPVKPAEFIIFAITQAPA